MSASDGETNTGGNQNEELNEKISMTPETRERIEGLMHDVIEGDGPNRTIFPAANLPPPAFANVHA